MEIVEVDDKYCDSHAGGQITSSLRLKVIFRSADPNLLIALMHNEEKL